MPELLNCVVCNGKVASDAIRCPHCNTERFKSDSFIKKEKKEYERWMNQHKPMRFDPVTGSGKSTNYKDLLEAVSNMSVGDKVLYEKKEYNHVLECYNYINHVGIITRIEPPVWHLFRENELPKVYVQKSDGVVPDNAIYKIHDIPLSINWYHWPRKIIDN